MQPLSPEEEDRVIEQIMREGPRGTWAVAGLATAVVVLCYLLFYVFVYLPRGAVQ